MSFFPGFLLQTSDVYACKNRFSGSVGLGQARLAQPPPGRSVCTTFKRVCLVTVVKLCTRSSPRLDARNHCCVFRPIRSWTTFFGRLAALAALCCWISSTLRARGGGQSILRLLLSRLCLCCGSNCCFRFYCACFGIHDFVLSRHGYRPWPRPRTHSWCAR